MQSTGIQPSQLLMEVLASTQDKIGQNISQSGFSQQLYEQHRLTQIVPFGLTASTFAQQAPSSNPVIPSQSVSTIQPPADGVRLPQTTAPAGNAVKGSPTASTAARDLVVSKWEITQQLTFSDSTALDKVLAQFRLSPSVSSPIENALNSQGGVSLQKLNECLDRAYSNKNELPPEGKAASADIQSLLAAVLQQQQIPVQALNDLGIQGKGVYDFIEFRELLRKVVNQVAKTGRKESGDSALPHASDTASAATKPAADAVSASRASLPSQTQSLAANLLPSFLKDKSKPSSARGNPTPAVVVSVADGSQNFKAQPLTTDETDGGEVGSRSQQSAGQLNGAVDPLRAGDAQDAAYLLSGAAKAPQAFLESIFKTVLNSPPAASDGPASQAEMLLSGESQAITADRMAGKPDADPASPSSGKQSVIQPSASILASASNAGEAVITARPAPTGPDLHPKGSPVEETISAKPAIPAVDKIAAPATANFTSPHSGSSGSPDSSSNSHAGFSPQDTQRPAEPGIKPFPLNASTERPSQYREQISADQTGLGVTTAATESSATTAILEPSRPVDPRGVSRDAIRLQTSTAADGIDKSSSMLRAAIPEQPRKTLPSTPVPEPQNGGRSPSTPAQNAPFPTLAATGKAGSAQTPSAGLSISVAAHGFSFDSLPHPVETQHQAPATTTATVEDAARTTSRRMAPLADAPGGSQVTAPLSPDVGGKAPTGFPTDGPDTTTREDSVATDNGKQFPRVTTPGGTASLASVSNSIMDPAGLLESNSGQQTKNRIAPIDLSATLLQETVAGPEPLTQEGFAPPAATEATLHPKFADSDPQDLTQATSNRPARDLGQAVTESPPRVTLPGSTEGGANTLTSVSQATFPSEGKQRFQNSVELLAKGTVEDKATANKSVPASYEAAEQTARCTSNDSGAVSTPPSANLEKAAPVAQTSGQSPSQEQGEEHPPTWFRNDAQMLTLPAATSVDKATEMFSSYASSLTTELAQRIQELHRQKRNELTLELQPKHLGRLLVTIGTDDDQVKTIITTESEQIKELLSRSSSVLRQALASQGLVLEQLQINVNSQPSANDQFYDKQGPGTRRNGSKPQAAPSDKGLGNSAARRTQIGSGDTLISIFV